MARTQASEGKIYLCAVKDVFFNRIVGYSIDSRMKARLAVSALEDAITRRQPASGLVVHSDRGSQFRASKFRRVLAAHGLIQSMGAVGTCADNAAMESFFNLVQTNVSTVRNGPPARSCASRWSVGSTPPTTADGAKEPSENSPHSNTR